MLKSDMASCAFSTLTGWADLTLVLSVTRFPHDASGKESSC